MFRNTWWFQLNFKIIFLISDNWILHFLFFSALDTTNVQIKKQVFELLSALCVYSSEGYNRALEALEHYKSFRSERYRFKLIVDELREAKKSEYQTVLLAFVNCLIISTPQLKVGWALLLALIRPDKSRQKPPPNLFIGEKTQDCKNRRFL